MKISPPPTKEALYADEEKKIYASTWNMWFNEAHSRLSGSYDFLTVNTTTTEEISKSVGTMYWNAIDGTVDLKLLNDTTLQMGQETYFYVKASGAIANGDLCMFAGVQGDHILAKKIGTGDIATVQQKPHYVIGIATQNIGNGVFGYVTAFGKINGVYTTGWATGDLLYFSNTTGQLTNVEPSAPARRIVVAAVIKAATGASENGVILTRITFGTNMMDLDDVDGVAPTVTGQMLVWNETSKYWQVGAAMIANYGTVMTFPTTSATIARTDAAQSFTGTQTFAAVDINGGAVDGTTIGSASPSTGAFTTLSASSGLNSTAVGNSVASTGAFTTLSATTSISSSNTISASGVISTQSNITASGSISATGNIATNGVFTVDGVQVVGNRYSDSRAYNSVGSTWDANAQGLLDAVRDALISHGLLS